VDGPVSMRLLPTKAVSKRGAGSRETLEDAVERVDKGSEYRGDRRCR
jgi:hypothetical protein